MTEYKAYVIIDGKPRWIIEDDTGKIINKNPNSEELKGLKTKVIKKRKTRNYSEGELIDILHSFFEKNGRIPIAKDFNDNLEYPSVITYQKRFGSWNNALNLAGLSERRKSKNPIKYSDEELLLYLQIYYDENGKAPGKRDFINNEYPDYQNYTKHFGSWNNALKMVGLDAESMVKKGNIKTDKQKGRLAEIMIMNHFDNMALDLSGKNCNSEIDGICPKGQIYDVKSSKLTIIGNWSGWIFGTHNKNKKIIEWYYFVAFNEDYSKLLYVWRVPGKLVKKQTFVVARSYKGEFIIENMKEYDITSKFKDMIDIRKWFVK